MKSGLTILPVDGSTNGHDQRMMSSRCYPN
jgi:hypothetical protein